MKSGLRAYFDLVSSQHDCYGTWLPGTRIELGEIGRITENGRFDRTGSVASRSEMPAVRSRNEPDQTISTSGGVTFSAGAAVEADQVTQVLATADAKLDVRFQRTNAAAMVLEEVTRHEFEDEQAVRKVMKQLLHDGNIAEDEVVVTYVLESASGVVATTFDAGSGADAEIGADLGAGMLTIARIGGRLQVASLNSSQTVVAAEPDRPLTPMYRALVFRHNRHWWSFWREYIEIGSAIPTRHFAERDSDADPIAAARPSMADAPKGPPREEQPRP